MKRILKWWALLTKRLYKKVTFVLILVLIPVLILAYGTMASEDSGMVTIALACEGNDSLAEQMFRNLEESSQIIRFLRCDTPEKAEEKVRLGKADAAWIFADDLEDRIDQFVESRSQRDAFVTVLERESNVSVMLAREKLSGVVFEACSEALYRQYIRENVTQLDHLTEEQLFEFYDSVSLDNMLFTFANGSSLADGEEAADSYLIAPVRGLLAVVVVLCGLATALYYIQDCRIGTFSWVPEKRLVWVEFGCQMVSVLNVSLVVLISLALLGETVNLGREILLALMYALNVAVFSMTLRRLCGGMRSLATLLPLLVVVMIVVCPVIFDLGALRSLQYLFPPTYYINAAVSDRYLLYLPIYTLAILAIYFLAGKILKRK